VTPFLTATAAMTTLILFGAVYVFIFSFGTYYIYRLLRDGPTRPVAWGPHDAVPDRPVPVANEGPVAAPSYVSAGE
jgi:cytochrome bd ubiquinol oxidase subunit I